MDDVRGWLYKTEGDLAKSWKRRFFALRGHQIRYYRSEYEANVDADGALGCIDLSAATAVDACSLADASDAPPFGILVACAGRLWELSAATEAERDTWVKTLRRLVHTAEESRFRVRIEGLLEKQGSLVRNWQQRWHVVGEDALFYFTDKVAADKFVAVAALRLANITERILKFASGMRDWALI